MSARKLLRGKVYLFEWNDTYGQQGWFDDGEVEKETIEGPQQSSVGFFVKEAEDWYVLAKHKNDYDSFPSWGHLSWIPKGAVKKVTYLFG